MGKVTKAIEKVSDQLTIENRVEQNETKIERLEKSLRSTKGRVTSVKNGADKALQEVIDDPTPLLESVLSTLGSLETSQAETQGAVDDAVRSNQDLQELILNTLAGFGLAANRSAKLGPCILKNPILKNPMRMQGPCTL